MKPNVNVMVGGVNNADFPRIYKTKFVSPKLPFAAQIDEPNTKYVIKHNFDLGGETVTVPEYCILEFDGGSLDNGVIVGQDTVFINVGDVDIWGDNITREGTWREHSGGGGDEPSEYIKDASVSLDGNTLTLTKKNETIVTFSPETGESAVTGVKGGNEIQYRTGNVNITKENIGLGKVGNFKAVSTEEHQGLSNEEKSNARANIGAGISDFSGNYNDLTDRPEIDNFVSSVSPHLVRNNAVGQTIGAIQEDISSIDGRLSENEEATEKLGTDMQSLSDDIDAKIHAEEIARGLAIGALASEVNSRLDEQDDALELLNGNEVIVVADHTAVQSPDSQKIYREQGSTSYTDWMYQDNEWKEIATYSFPGTDNEPTPNSSNVVSSDGLSKIVGYYIENPEYIRLLVDADNRILFGIKKSGSIVFGDTIPQSIRNYISAAILDLEDSLSKKVDSVDGKSLIDSNFAEIIDSIENPEYLDVKIDKVGHIIEGIKKSGTKEFGVDAVFRGDAKVEGTAKLEGDAVLYGQSDFKGNIKTGEAVTEIIQNEEFIRLYVDKDNHILFGIKRNGGTVFGEDIISELRNEIEELVKNRNTDKDDIPDTMALPDYTYVVATYDLFIAKTDEGLDKLYFSDDLGATWSNPVVIPDNLNPIRHAHFFSDGTLLVCGTKTCAYITPFNPNDRTTFHYSEIYDVDGSVYNPTRDGFYTQGVSNDIVFCKDSRGNDVEVKVFGDYMTEWDYNGNGIIDREDMEAMHPRLWCTTDRGRTIRCIFESGVSEIDGEVITIRHFHHVDYCKKTNKFYISTGDFDQDEYAPDDPRHINYTQNYFLEASFTTDNNDDFDWSFDIIGSGKSFKIGGFWFDDNYAYLFTDYTTGEELKPKGILRCPIDGLRNFDNYKNIYHCPPDEWGSIAPIGMVEDNNGNKVLFPDYLGYGFIWVATEGYNFKKVRLNKHELIGYDRIGPNANGDIYITRSTGDSYPKGWDRNAPWYSLNALLKNNGINGFFKKTNK